MAEYAVARVRLWGQEVGALTEDSTRRIAFEYEPSFQRSGLEISPLHLPLDRGGVFTFPELQRKEAFQGLPGVFADALPDRFGNAVIARYFEEQGRPHHSLSPTQKLLYIGSRAMGALTFHPEVDRRPGTEEALEIQDLVEQARHVIEGNTDVAIPEIMQVGATAGGARAKALILWDREQNRVRSGFATPRDGEESWLIKFDGVTSDSGGVGMAVHRRPQPWGRIEYVYSRMARDASIEMAECHLMRDGDLAHFMTRRFDRRGPDPLHVHTLAGFLHVDFNDQYTLSYEQYFDALRMLGLGQRSVEQAFRRMVFSVATINFDDHPKNFAMTMDREGRWALAPAYDVAYAEGGPWTRQHQMSVAGKFGGLTREDLLGFGETFDISQREVIGIIGEVVASLDGWRRYAQDAAVPREMIDHLEGRFERLN
jgi:serine/threonine-protein kinase HipA